MSDTSNTVNQQNSIPDPAATEAEKKEEVSTDTRVARCILYLTLVDGNNYSNEMLIPMKDFESVRNNMVTSLTNQKGEGVLSLFGSLKSQYDWAHIPVRSIIMMNLTFAEMVELRDEIQES